MIQRRRTAFFGVLLALMLVILPKFNLVTQESLPETIEFSDEIITFKQSSGIVLRVSRPFRRFQKWDTEHTGDSWFSIALEFTNNTDLFISAINFRDVVFRNRFCGRLRGCYWKILHKRIIFF